MALTTAQQASELDKKAQGKSSTNTTRDFFEEPYNGRAAVFADQIWTESTLIPTTAPTLAPDATSGVVQYKEDLTLAAVAGTSNSFYHADLVDCIPFNFGDGSYNYALEDSSSNAIAFGQGDWRVDITTGVLTFYGTVPSNMPPKITFYKYIGDKADDTSFGGTGGGAVSVDTITGTDTVANGTTLAKASASTTSYTITLPSSATATSNLILKRTDALLQYVITWAAIGGETVNGAASILSHTQNETWELCPNGTNWEVVDHRTKTPWITVEPMVGFYTFTITSGNATIGATYTNNAVTFTVAKTIAAQTTLVCQGASAPAVSGTLTKSAGTGDATITFSAYTGNPFKIRATTTTPVFFGNPTENFMKYRRDGSRIIIWQKFYWVTTAGLIGSGDYIFPPPTGVTFDSSVYPYFTGGTAQSIQSQTALSTASIFPAIGGRANGQGGAQWCATNWAPYDANGFRIYGNYSNTDGAYPIGSSYVAASVAGGTHHWQIEAPVTGWTD